MNFSGEKISVKFLGRKQSKPSEKYRWKACIYVKWKHDGNHWRKTYIFLTIITILGSSECFQGNLATGTFIWSVRDYLLCQANGWMAGLGMWGRGDCIISSVYARDAFQKPSWGFLSTSDGTKHLAAMGALLASPAFLWSTESATHSVVSQMFFFKLSLLFPLKNIVRGPPLLTSRKFTALSLTFYKLPRVGDGVGLGKKKKNQGCRIPEKGVRKIKNHLPATQGNWERSVGHVLW